MTLFGEGRGRVLISIIVPTYNERNNIGRLIPAIEKNLDQASVGEFEILVMDDDSPDGTSERILEMKDPRVRLVNRRGRPRGLSQAVLDGFGEARGEILGVMDADLSHPPETLPSLIAAVREEYLVAVGSRYVPGGGVRQWPWRRVVTSKIACWLARPVTPVKDSTSGFFFLKKSVLEGVVLNPSGFKIGLEVFVRSKHGGKIKEVPYIFTDRKEGVSKFNGRVAACYVKQLFSLMRENARGRS